MPETGSPKSSVMVAVTVWLAPVVSSLVAVGGVSSIAAAQPWTLTLGFGNVTVWPSASLYVTDVFTCSTPPLFVGSCVAVYFRVAVSVLSSAIDHVRTLPACDTVP
jgi:hypothetical protein